MGRAVTKNSQGELEVTETLIFSGSNPTLDSVKLIAKDGASVSKENPSWLGFTQATSGSDLNVTLQLDVTGLEEYTTYTFEIAGTDDTDNEIVRRVNVGVGSLSTDFQIQNVMGQEDKYRSENSERVVRGGTARVILTTTMPAAIDLEYVRDPGDVDDPTFTQSSSSVSQNKTQHEFFFPVVLSSFYAFRVTAEADFDQSVPQRTSSVYFFTTGTDFSTEAGATLTASLEDVGLISFAFDQVIGESGDSTSSVYGSSVSNDSDAAGLTANEESVSLETFAVTVDVLDPTDGHFSTPFSTS